MVFSSLSSGIRDWDIEALSIWDILGVTDVVEERPARVHVSSKSAQPIVLRVTFLTSSC